MTRSHMPWWKLMLLMRSIGISTPCFASTPVRNTTRSVVTTKCVKFQSRYLMPSQTAHAIATIAQNHRTASPGVPRNWNDSQNSSSSGIAVRMCFEKNHQCGRRSRATSSPSLSNLLGYGTSAIVGPKRPRFVRKDQPCSGPHVARQPRPRGDRRLDEILVGTEILGDQEPTRALGQRVAHHQRVVVRTVRRDEQVGELMHEDVVEDPARKGSETCRDTDRSVL